jgi:hypothetical protein
LAVKRKAAHKKEDLELHFKECSNTIIKYGIKSADIYNIDETGFQIRVIAGRVVITHLLTKAVYLTDPDNQELITAVKTVYADCSTIPLMLILKEDVLLKKHFENDLKNKTLFATSLIGYSNKGLGIKYLIHFYNNTYKKTKGK